MHSASVDIAIVNYRSAHDTLGALARLAQWPHGRVWLVDNSAHESDMHDESALLRQAVATMPWVTLLNPGANLGFGRACNLAFEQSDAEFFLLLNPDARIAQQDLMRMLQCMQGNPSLGAVSPRLFWNAQRSFMLPAAFPQSPWYSLALALATRARPLARWAALRGLQRAMRQMASQSPFEVGFLAGAVMLLRRSAVLSAGGLFDPDYFMFFEDTDLSLRLRRAGHALALVPAASAVHEYRHRASKGPLMAHSQLQFFRKQHPVFFRLSDGLRRMSTLQRPMALEHWYRVLAQPLTSAADFARQSEGARVLAFSPAALLMPALFRPLGEAPRPFDEDEWALLEPARYTALALSDDPAPRLLWLCFERAPDAGTHPAACAPATAGLLSA